MCSVVLPQLFPFSPLTQFSSAAQESLLWFWPSPTRSGQAQLILSGLWMLQPHPSTARTAWAWGKAGTLKPWILLRNSRNSCPNTKNTTKTQPGLGCNPFSPSQGNQAWKRVCCRAEGSSEIRNPFIVVSCSTLHCDLS